jgi:ribonuclease E
VAEVAAAADGEQGGEAANNTNDQAPRRDGEERRGRSRDRYGRDRRERGPRDDSEAGAPAAEGAVAAAAEAATSDSASYEAPVARQPQQLPLVSETVAAERQFAAAPEAREPAPQQQARFERPAAAPSPVAAPIVVETANKAAPAGNGRALPKVQAFELPLNELAQIAESSGLQWVNSDAERIAQARAAIAAEPKPVHVPRERPPAVVLDEGPLVLVETRRDLGSMSLPFEKAATDTQQPSTY